MGATVSDGELAAPGARIRGSDLVTALRGGGRVGASWKRTHAPAELRTLCREVRRGGCSNQSIGGRARAE
eukprot:9027301-Alexandrium_andersonii.AAC.1